MGNTFLPVNRQDMADRGWEQCDFVLISGDAYVDHPSFASAIISRTLEQAGYKVGIIAQPDWQEVEDFRRLGKPALAFLVSPGNIDSMVSHYTVNRKIRSQDAYSPGGQAGKRPDRASIVYCTMARQAYKGVPVVLGGIEASLRRFSHYDYWSDKVRRSILLDAKADLLMYGMGERSILEIAEHLASGVPVKEIRDVRGTVYAVSSPAEIPQGAVVLPSHEDICADKTVYAASFLTQYRNTDPIASEILAEPSASRFVVQNRPAFPLSREEMDRTYSYPYTRKAHPDYEADGGIPALKEVEFSLVHNRG
ncbi:MAG: YgiQ family radical SAM protein, partial [Spirochaetales bacterium]|nr:YgiQ family radical SAM protein [Spirochaetales bacterium]